MLLGTTAEPEIAAVVAALSSAVVFAASAAAKALSKALATGRNKARQALSRELEPFLLRTKASTCGLSACYAAAIDF